MKKIYFVTTLLCTLFAFACSSSAASDAPSKVVRNFYDAINAEKYQEAAECLYYEGKSIEKDKQMMTEMLATYLGPQLKQLGGVKVENLTEKIGDDGEAVVEFYMKNGQGQGGKETAKCVKDASGAWKMRAAF